MFRSVNLKNHPGDRFIPLRVPVNIDFGENETNNYIDTEAEFINYAKIRYNQLNYQNALRSVLLPVNTKVLNFFPPKKFEMNDFQSQRDDMWPVKPRKKTVIGPPEIILDMPHFDSSIYHHVADWSTTNWLATIFENEVHMWHPDSDLLRSSTDTRGRVHYCIKWKYDGTQLALGLFPNRFGIYDVATKKLTDESFCCTLYCKIFSLEWINDKYIITGCSKGVLKMYSSNLRCLKKVSDAHNSAIIKITSSCNKKIIASSGMDRTVVIWKIPELEGLFQIKFSSVIRALAWHPWRNALLAIGLGYGEGRVILWNVNTHKQEGGETSTYKNSTVDSLTFNPTSGELVVSYFVPYEHDASKGSGVIAVLANMDRVVEELHIHRGPIPYLLWGYEGNSLASVSADENLCIWNFFGLSDIDKKTKNEVKKNNNCKWQSFNVFGANIR